MREFKFKVWDNKECMWTIDPRTQVNFLNLPGEVLSIEGFGRYSIRQYTDMSDGNKREIYELDMLSYHGEIGPVQFSSGSFLFMSRYESIPLSQMKLDDAEFIGYAIEQ
jgi:hypothetical protein